MHVGALMSVRLVTVTPEDSVSDAITRMNDSGVGSVVVCDGPRLVGIFTERDVLRLAATGDGFAGRQMRDVMTSRVLTIAADDDVLAAARLMSERRIRHLPVVEGENVIGMLGIRDAMRLIVERLFSEHDAQARETARELLRPGASPR
jgi:CBS domain-containing protein